MDVYSVYDESVRWLLAIGVGVVGCIALFGCGE